METCTENRTVILCYRTFQHPGEPLIRIEIYSIDNSFNGTLVQVASTEANCCGGGMLGNFSSPKHGEFVAVWGDLSNDSFFFTFQVTLASAIEVQTDFIRTELNACALPFELLDEVCPGPASSLYSCQVFAVGGHHADCINVEMFQIHRQKYCDERLETVFHQIVKLPHTMQSVPTTHKRNKQSLYASIEGIVFAADGTVRALLSVMVAEGHRADEVLDDASAACDTSAAAVSPEEYVLLLLHLQRNSVLDMHSSDLHDKYTVDAAGEHIVRFIGGGM